MPDCYAIYDCGRKVHQVQLCVIYVAERKKDGNGQTVDAL